MVTKSNFSKGYTIIEILVAVGIFTMIIAAPTGFLVGSLKGQQRALSSQELVDSVSYTLEYMSRALRMAKKDLTGACIEKGSNYENPTNDISKIRFLNYKGYCQEFSVSDAQLKERKSTDGSEENLGEFFPLTSNDLEVELVRFQLSGQSQDDDLQPRITLFLKVKGARGQKPELQPEIKIQTTISQRNLDVVYY